VIVIPRQVQSCFMVVVSVIHIRAHHVSIMLQQYRHVLGSSQAWELFHPRHCGDSRSTHVVPQQFLYNVSVAIPAGLHKGWIPILICGTHIGPCCNRWHTSWSLPFRAALKSKASIVDILHSFEWKWMDNLKWFVGRRDVRLFVLRFVYYSTCITRVVQVVWSTITIFYDIYISEILITDSRYREMKPWILGKTDI
jgi:hypothetical protein